MKARTLYALCTFLTAVLLLSLGACGKRNSPAEQTGTQSPTEKNTADADKEKPVFPDTASGETDAPVPDAEPTFDLTICGNSIKQYRIVYAHNPEQEAADSLTIVRKNITDSDFDRQTAERLRDVIQSVCGIRLDVVEDTSKAGKKETLYEITVGKTNRSATRELDVDGIPTDGYRILTAGNYLAFGGETYGSTWHAADAFENLLRQAVETGEDGLDLGEDFRIEGTYHLLRIGCIGDSITCGWNPEYFNYQYLTYPKLLGYLLWKDAVVTNYAVSGKTMKSYTETDLFRDCVNDAPGLDVVTVMLGTNDARAFNNDNGWTAAYESNFKAAAKTITDNLRSRNSEIGILFLSSPDVYEVRYGETGLAIRSVVKAQREIQAYLESRTEPQKVDFYDMNAALQASWKEFTKPDGIHLTVAGLSAFAKELAPVIRNLYLKE